MPITRSSARNKNLSKEAVETKSKVQEEPPKKKSRAKKQKETPREEEETETVDDAETEAEENLQKTKVPSKKNTKGKKQETEPVGDSENEEDWQNASTIYEFTAKDINGKEVSLSKYKGHVCIIVNVASRCGHTKSNYEQFNDVYTKYADTKGIKILAFPCNQFGGQEPGDSTKICEFIKKRSVDFDMFEKIDVNGKKAHPLWKFLKEKIDGPKGPNIDWNFTKFIINKEGKVVERFKPTVKPLQLVEHLEKYW